MVVQMVTLDGVKLLSDNGSTAKAAIACAGEGGELVQHNALALQDIFSGTVYLATTITILENKLYGQNGVEQIKPGEIIQLTSGTFVPTGGKLSPAVAGITIIGTGDNTSIIDGQIAWDAGGDMRQCRLDNVRINCDSTPVHGSYGVNEFANGSFILNYVNAYGNDYASSKNIFTFSAKTSYCIADVYNCHAEQADGDCWSTKCDDADEKATMSRLRLIDCTARLHGGGGTDQLVTAHDGFMAQVYRGRYYSPQASPADSDCLMATDGNTKLEVYGAILEDGYSTVTRAKHCQILMLHTTGTTTPALTIRDVDGSLIEACGNYLYHDSGGYGGIAIRGGNGAIALVQDNIIWGFNYASAGQCVRIQDTFDGLNVDIIDNTFVDYRRGIESAFNGTGAGSGRTVRILGNKFSQRSGDAGNYDIVFTYTTVPDYMIGGANIRTEGSAWTNYQWTGGLE